MPAVQVGGGGPEEDRPARVAQLLPAPVSRLTAVPKHLLATAEGCGHGQCFWNLLWPRPMQLGD